MSAQRLFGRPVLRAVSLTALAALAVLDDGREQLRAGYAAIGAGDPDAG